MSFRVLHPPEVDAYYDILRAFCASSWPNPLMNKPLLTFIMVVTSTTIGNTATVQLAEDGTLVVDGTRRFPIGLYESPTDDEYVQEVAKAGFNVMTCRADPDQLDRAHLHGIGAWVPLGHLPVADEGGKAALSKEVNAVKHHPALWVWEAPDEILWNLFWPRVSAFFKERKDLTNRVEAAMTKQPESAETLAGALKRYDDYAMSERWAEAEAAAVIVREHLGLPPRTDDAATLSGWHDNVEILFHKLAEGSEVVRQLDPGRPIWFNHAPRNEISDLRRINALADIAGCDIYPVPFNEGLMHSDIIERHLPAVGAYTRRMAEGAPGKPMWMVLQAFGWSDLQEPFSPEIYIRPSYEESRFMAYDAIVNGARGILYYGSKHLHETEKNSSFWQDLKRVTRELADFESQLAAPEWKLDLRIDYSPTSSSRDRGVLTAARGNKDDGIIILVNEHVAGLAFDLHGLDEFEGRALPIVGSWERPIVKNGAIRFGLRGHGVTVIRTQK